MSAPKSFLRTSAEDWEGRRRASALPKRWDVAPLAARVRAEVAQAESEGLLDPRLLDAYEAELVVLIDRTLSATFGEARDAMGVGVAERVFGTRVYKNRLDRQLATASGAVADVLVEEALLVAASAASLDFYRSQRVLDPAWPPRHPVDVGSLDGSVEAAGGGGAALKAAVPASVKARARPGLVVGIPSDAAIAPTTPSGVT